MRSTHCDVLLIAADWQSRTLVLAELREAGYLVIAAPGLRHAYRSLLGRRVRPKVIVLDVSGDEEATPGYVEQIPELAPGTALLLLVGTGEAAAWQSLQDRGAEILRRPLTVGEVVEAVRRRLTGTAGRSA